MQNSAGSAPLLHATHGRVCDDGNNGANQAGNVHEICTTAPP